MRNETTRMLRDLVVAMEARATLAATAPDPAPIPAPSASSSGRLAAPPGAGGAGGEE